MANDILDTTGSATGQEKLGNVTVKATGGGGTENRKINTAGQHIVDITNIAGKYDARFDDPTYYG